MKRNSASAKVELVHMLIGACRNGHVQAVAYVLDLGANPFIRCTEDFGCGETALIAASRYGHADIVALCCFHEKWVGLNTEGVAVQDSQGLTALNWAVRMQHVDVLSVLLFVCPAYIEQVEVLARTPSMPSSLLSSPEFAALVRNHFPKYDYMLLSPRSEPRWRRPVSLEEFVKQWCCNYSSWLKLESAFVGYAPYACFASLIIGFVYSLLFASFQEMWEPHHSKMTVLHVLNFAAQGFLWFFVFETRRINPGRVETSKSSYTEAIKKVLTSARSGVADLAALASSGPAQQLHSKSSSSRGSSQPPPDRLPSRCCHVCRIWKSSHVGHSPITHQCIPIYDHYCVYLGRDIGQYNYPQFFGALSIMGAVCLPIFFLMTVTFIQRGLVPRISVPYFPASFHKYFLDVFLFWAILGEIQMLLFLGFHTFAVSFGYTTREMSKTAKTPATSPSSSFGPALVWKRWVDRMWPLKQGEANEEDLVIL